MPKITGQNTSKMFGIYLIIILAIVRFLVYPMQASLTEKKTAFNGLYETCQLKLSHFAGQSMGLIKPAKSPLKREAVAPSLYEKEMSFSSIQADVLEGVMKIAEKKGLVVQNFEMPALATGKTISEVPVIIRLSGKPGDLLDLLKTIGSDRRVLQVKSLEINKGAQEMALALTLVAFRMEK